MIPAAEVALQTAVSIPLRVTRRIVSSSWSSESPADTPPTASAAHERSGSVPLAGARDPAGRDRLSDIPRGTLGDSAGGWSARRRAALPGPVVFVVIVLAASTHLLPQLESSQPPRSPRRREGGSRDREPEVAKDPTHDIGIGEKGQDDHRNALLSARAAGTRERVHRQHPPEQLGPRRSRPGRLDRRFRHPRHAGGRCRLAGDGRDVRRDVGEISSAYRDGGDGSSFRHRLRLANTP